MSDRPTSAQVRGARAMLGWSLIDLAQAAKVSVSVVKRVEDSTIASVPQAALDGVQRALEAAGVRFIPDEGDGPGLRLRPKEVSPIARFF